MATLETLNKEIGEIKDNVEKILFILENEGDVREEVLSELVKSMKAPEEKFIPHENVRKALIR